MTRFGRYELEGLLGRGGCGEVWKARDMELGRVVAVKMLQRSSGEDLARFRREAQVTARLNHPNIAQLYEFGENFIAMQYIEGVPISKPEHLADAARAVHYAHGQGVLHRDLKPANILVASGRAYVLDFGLAREVKGDATAMSLTGDILGTPSYMAPEQARGEVHRLDARTDVYGLGATLYALLEGRPPHTGPSAYEVVRKVIEEEPAAPKGELGVIAMKAMEKDPERRYATAAEFAEDLDRHMRNEPILARPASWAYRMRKRVARQPVAWSLGALLALAIVGGAAFGFIQLAQRVLVEQEARLRQEQANASLAVQGLIERSSRRIRELETTLARRVDDPTLVQAFGELDALAAELRNASRQGVETGALHLALGEALVLRQRDDLALDAFSRAIEAGDAAVERSARLGRLRARLGLFQDLLASMPGDPDAPVGIESTDPPSVVEDVAALAGDTLPEAVLWARVGRNEFASVVEGVTGRIEEGGRNEEFYYLRGITRIDRGDFAGAIDDLEASLDRNYGRARAWFHYGNALASSGRFEDAVMAFSEAIRLRVDYDAAINNRGTCHSDLQEWDRAVEDYTTVLSRTPDYPGGLRNRAIALRRLGDLPGALADLDRAIELRPTHALALVQRAGVRFDSGDAAGARTDLDAALGVDPEFPDALSALGGLEYAAGRYDSAEDCFGRLVAACPEDAQAWANLGLSRYMRGRFDEAGTAFTRTLNLNPDHEEAHFHRGNARIRTGDLRGGIDDLSRAIDLNPRRPDSWANRAAAWLQMHEADRALADCDEALRLRADFSIAQVNRAGARAQLGDYAGAVGDLRAVLLREPSDWPSRAAVESRLEEYEALAP